MPAQSAQIAARLSGVRDLDDLYTGWCLNGKIPPK